MNKKLWLTTLASPIAILPILTTVACQTSATDNETKNQIGDIGNSELSRFTFLLFKSNVISLVNRHQIKDSEELKKCKLKSKSPLCKIAGGDFCLLVNKN